MLEKIALTFVEGAKAPLIKRLAAAGLSLSDFFSLDMVDIAARLGEPFAISNVVRQEALFRARAELEFVKKHNIRVLYFEDDDYPVLLRETPDAPVVLFVLGNVDFNATHTFNVVGTRRCTSYGINFSRQFVLDMVSYYPDALVVSGLAYGIDASAHRAALEAHARTVAVVAHGLDMIYPAAHRNLARQILAEGGAIVSEYPSTTRPLQRNFLERNRIIAGLCEFTFVAESEVRGGAMNTAHSAFSYSREVFALPGRFNDQTSSGCNKLIARNVARIFTSLPDLFETLRWPLPVVGKQLSAHQQNLFPELQGDAASVFDCIRKRGAALSVDEIHQAVALPVPTLMAVLTELEFDGLIVKLPGSRYELT